VPEVERSIETIKERVRATVHGLPYTRLPILFIKHLIVFVVQSLNRFPWQHGVSAEMSPDTLVTGSPPPDYRKLRIDIGAYAQVFESPNPTNTPISRSLGAIALEPTGNADGSYHFLSLATGALIPRNQWTECPITDATVARVAALAIRDGQPLRVLWLAFKLAIISRMLAISFAICVGVSTTDGISGCRTAFA
jgi:hypothetical protein